MKSIEFIASFGDEKKKIKISQPTGSGEQFFLYINDYYQGMINKVNNEWYAHLNKPAELTGDDLSVIYSLIEDQIG